MCRKLLFGVMLVLLFCSTFFMVNAAENPDVLLISDFEPEEKMWYGYDQSGEKTGLDPKNPPAGHLHIGDFQSTHVGYFSPLTEGLIFDDKHVKHGKTSGKWANTVVNSRIVTKKIPHDWSKYSYFSMWVYSETANKAGFAIALYSEPGVGKDNYYQTNIIINWTGWRLIEIPLSAFNRTRKPAGWHKIDYIKIASSGWGNSPAPDTVLYFDRMQLTKESVMNEILYEIPFTFKVVERPGLLVNKAELEEAKAKVKKYDWAREAYNNLKLTADAWLNTKIELPKTGGGFYHEVGDTKYPYELTAKHYEFARAARSLGLMYWLDGNESYAKKAKEIILAYKDKYLTYTMHDKDGNEGDKAGAGGRVTAQSINEAQWVIPLAWAYDLLYHKFTVAERKEIEERIFHPVAQLLMRVNEGRHNHQAWYNSGIGVIGFLLKEKKYVLFALHKFDSGFYFQMENSITPDGLWYEGSGHYHYYAMRCLKDLSDAAIHSGINLFENEAYRSIYTFPIVYQDPSAELPTTGDGRVVNLYEDDRADLFESAYRHTRDPYIVPILKNSSRNSIDALLYGVAELPEVNLPPLTSRMLASGQAVLRSGTGNQVENFLVMNGMPYAGGHSHYDKMGIQFYANGRTQAPDPGSIRYRDPRHDGWFKSTLAHNTVALNERNQVYSGKAKVQYFSGGSTFQAVRMQDDRCYPGSLLDRTALLSDWYLFDLFRITSSQNNTADWAYHNYGVLKTDFALNPIKLPNTPGYKYLENPVSAKINGEFKVTWENNDGKIELNQLTKDENQVISGNGMVATRYDDVPSEEKVPALLIRKSGKSILFNSLIVPVKDDFKYSVTQFSYQLSGKEQVTEPVGAYRITSVKGDDIVYFNYNKNLPVKLGAIETNALTAMIRMEKGVPTEVFIAKGNTVSGRNWKFEISDLTVASASDVGTLQVSVGKKEILVKSDSDSTVILNFSKRKVKSLEMLKDGKWVVEEPIEVDKGVFSFLAEPGAQYRLNF